MSTLVVGLICVFCIGFPQQGIAAPPCADQYQSVLLPAQTEFNGQVSNHHQISYRPSAGIIVSADAKAVFKNALAQSWNCVSDQLGRNCVHARTLSKIDYQIQPYRSFDGALLQINMNGTSSGESVASRGEKNQIVMDTLTKFKSRQMLLLRPDAVEYGRPDVRVNTSQSFKRAENANPLTLALVKHALKKPSDKLKNATNHFSKKQIEQNIYKHLALTLSKSVSSIHQVFHQVPTLQSYDWTLSSDDRYIYASAAHLKTSDVLSDQAYSRSQEHPLSITLSKEFANRILNDHLSNKTFGSVGIEEKYDQVSKFIQLPKLTTKNDQYWTIQLGDQPAKLTFVENELRCEIKTDKISSSDNLISNMVIGFSYRPTRKHGFWYFVRNAEVVVYESSDHDGQLGARQLGFRTVMRKRLERVIPKYFAIKKFAGSQGPQNTLDLDLSLDKIRLSSSQMYLGFQTK